MTEGQKVALARAQKAAPQEKLSTSRKFVNPIVSPERVVKPKREKKGVVEADIARPERPKSAPPESNVLKTEQEHKKALWNGGFSSGWQEVSPEKQAAILDVGASMKAAKAEWTQRHRSTAVNHFMRFLKRKELSVEQLLLEDVGTQEGAKRASTLIKLFLFYLSNTIQAKLGVGLGPASTTTTYARGAIAFVAEKLEEDFEMEQAERWRKLCQRITKEYEPGRETQLIGIRGVRIVRHKAQPSE